MDTAMPQSNPQAEIQNILKDVSSSLQNAPKRKMNKKRLWLVIVVLLVLVIFFIFFVINTTKKPKQKALSEAEISRIVKVLEERDSTPVSNAYVQDISSVFDEREDTPSAPTNTQQNNIISTLENRQ